MSRTASDRFCGVWVWAISRIKSPSSHRQSIDVNIRDWNERISLKLRVGERFGFLENHVSMTGGWRRATGCTENLISLVRLQIFSSLCTFSIFETIYIWMRKLDFIPISNIYLKEFKLIRSLIMYSVGRQTRLYRQIKIF